ncbi:hypothetical protein NFI95_14080 [Acetobacteraceae bacterium KSS8]|uniref:YfhO family protein n=1 Tax=Endosaccharibacter trunci TaxID=2812733 RepID=A0ABT1WAY2_9PROT|nr:hypothetical protein [Acetobacteraceae bacterium KSS8]
MKLLHDRADAAASQATAILPFALCAALVLTQWWPGLTQGRIPIWGDALPFGWPLLELHAEALHGQASLLWSDGIYGGHPIFAEGQGGFAHPLNLLLALLVTPGLGAPFSGVILHVVDLLCMALGMALLGRRLGFSLPATAFSVLGVVFSPAILLQQNNMAIGGALGFVPLSLWAFERCWDRRDARSAALLAVMLSLVVLAGYPQTLHALLIVLAGRSIVPALCGQLRRPRAAFPWRLIAALSGALLLLLGLTAVQILPMAQLARESHRAGGVALAARLPWRLVLRSLAMGDLRAGAETIDEAFGPGSLLVCGPATLLLALRGKPIPPGMIGYAVSILVCLLATATDTPVFSLLHAGLLPGMRFFRVTVLYEAVATIPIALLSGFLLDQACFLHRRIVALVSGGWLAMLVTVHPVLAPMAIGTALSGLFLMLRRRRGVATAMLALLLLETATLRLHPFPFQPRSILAMPDAARAIRDEAPDPLDRRLYGVSLAAIACMMLPQQQGEPAGIRRAITSLVPMTGLIWSIPSMGGALALPLQRRMLAEPLLADGVQGNGPPPGSRLIDLLSVGFLFSDHPSGAAALTLAHENPGGTGWIYRNTAARPFAQGFAGHVSVPDAATAAKRLAGLKAPALVIEDPSHRAPPDAANATAPSVTVLKARPTRIALSVRSDGPGWVLVTDAFFPGWSATLDGRPIRVFPAQLLAKAMAVPAGQHVLVLRYRSAPFEIGLVLSLISLGVAGLVLVRR